ncbi:MAG: M50 family metallopeptidase [Dermatophilaceae bacterium]
MLVDWIDEVWSRALPGDGTALVGAPLVVVLVAALIAVTVRPVWGVLRLGVTLVHELGHAAVGILCGRRFTGFVLRGDMSGHAVTVGPVRGIGRAATTWAGYPMPALVGAGLVVLATRGWSATVLTGAIAVLILGLLRAGSLLTAAVVAAVILGAGALWWSASDQVQAQVVTGAGLVLVVGAWRHLAPVLAGPDGGVSDPAVLARLTRVPRAFWVLTHLAACAVATWLVIDTVLGAIH